MENGTERICHKQTNPERMKAMKKLQDKTYANNQPSLEGLQKHTFLSDQHERLQGKKLKR